MTNDYIQSPLNYTGGKYKLLPQLLPLFQETDCFFDLFAGGANVSINMNNKKVIINDNNEHIIELYKFFNNNPVNLLMEKIDEIITKYELSNTSKFGYEYYDCDSKNGLGNYNKDKFLKLRADYNKSKDTLLLYVLIVYAFNNQIRFNQKGEFNLPIGKRDFNKKMQQKFELFVTKLQSKNIEFYHQDFRQFDLNKLPKNTLIYCDPPYLITLASYNENKGWGDKDEFDLLKFLDNANKLGLKFALSNVIQAKNQENHILRHWLTENNYTCHFLDKSYANSSYQRRDKDSKSVEVLITNY